MISQFTHLPSLPSGSAVIATVSGFDHPLVGCVLHSSTQHSMDLQIWNGYDFMTLRIPRTHIRNLHQFPCGPIGAHLVVVRLTTAYPLAGPGHSLVGCQAVTAPGPTTTLTVFAGNHLIHLPIPNHFIQETRPFPCTERTPR